MDPKWILSYRKHWGSFYLKLSFTSRFRIMDYTFMNVLTWIGIVFCISQSAIFSGMNLALFSIGRLRLEVEATSGNKDAIRLLRLRENSNFILTTVLWGNVGINVLLTLLSNSVLTGVSAFLFSTMLITFAGEILPQAYFSRHALKMVSKFAPILKFYQYLLYPFTKSSALFLDWWLGKESIQYFREHNIREIIKKHIEADDADIDRIEGLGAINFLAIDDLIITEEGETIDPMSLVELPTKNEQLVFQEYTQDASDPFLRLVEKSSKKWVVLTDINKNPLLVLDADSFLRHALFKSPSPDPLWYCHKPIIVEDASIKLGKILNRFVVKGLHPHDDIIEQDIILLWGAHKRIITGADILGRLMRGISTKELSV
jgi:metal transporter CNNM